MEMDRYKEWAGSLDKELQEINELNANSDSVDKEITITMNCTSFFTIICC